MMPHGKGLKAKRRKTENVKEREEYVSEIEESSSDTEASDSTLTLQQEDQPTISIASSQYGDGDEILEDVVLDTGEDNGNKEDEDKHLEELRLVIKEEQMNILIQEQKIDKAFRIGTEISQRSDRLKTKLMLAECLLRQGSDMFLDTMQEILKNLPRNYKEEVGEKFDELGEDFLKMNPPRPFPPLILFICAAVSHSDAQNPEEAAINSDQSIGHFSTAVLKINEEDVDDWKRFKKIFSRLIEFVYNTCFVQSTSIPKTDTYLRYKSQVSSLKHVSEACLHLKLFTDAATYCEKGLNIIEDKEKSGKRLMESPIYGDLLHTMGKAVSQNVPSKELDWLKKALLAKKKIKFDTARAKDISIESTKTEMDKLKKQRN